MMMNRRNAHIRSFSGLAALAAAATVLSGCARNYPMDTLSTGSDLAVKIRSLYIQITVWDTIILAIVIGTLFGAIFWFSKRVGDPGEPSTTTSDIRLEVAWTAIPSLILALIAVPTVRTIIATQPDAWPANALTIRVVAHQWWWEFKYPQYGIDTADEVHMPANREIHFELESADIIHSFWVPALGGKRDVVPGQLNEITMIPHQLGYFYGQCVEFCGSSHANMRLRGIVDSEADFDKWVKNQQAGPVITASGPAADGAKVWANAPCAICHTIKGVSGFSSQYKGGFKGPDLTHFGSRTTLAGGVLDNTPQNVALWIQNPGAVKPGAMMPNLGIHGEDMTNLVAYLESLK